MQKDSKVLYRGSKEHLKVISPAKILENELKRFPSGITEAVFVTPYKQEALSYAISARKGLSGTLVTPYYKNQETKEMGWKIELGFKKSHIDLNEKTYLYEFSPSDFKQNSYGEWYATAEQTPQKVIEMTVSEALSHFDEVKFESEEIKTEGQTKGQLL